MARQRSESERFFVYLPPSVPVPLLCFVGFYVLLTAYKFPSPSATLSTFRSHLLCLARRRPASKQPFVAHDWVNPTLDGGVFLLANSAPAERMHPLCDEGHILTMNSSNYLVSPSFVFDHRDMRTRHFSHRYWGQFLTSSTPMYSPSTGVPISSHRLICMPWLGDTNGRTL